MWQYIFLFTVVFCAYTIKSITGFGNTLVINSLYSFVDTNRFITPVDLILGLPTNIYMAWKDRRSIDYGIVVPLSITVILGNIPGILFLDIGADKLLKSLLGVTLIVLSAEMLIRGRIKSRINRKGGKGCFIFAVGIISGILMGLYGIGALLAAYINKRTEYRESYRANLCFIFVADNIFRLVGYSYKGIISRDILLISLFLMPAVIAGMALGRKIDSKVNEGFVKTAVTIMLFVTGTIYIVVNRFGF